MPRLYETGDGSNTNIYNRKINIFWSRWLKPGPARPKPGPVQILEIWEPGNPEIWNPKKTKKKRKFSTSKSMSPKMSARSGLAEKRTSRPHSGPSQAIFCVGQKNRKKKSDVCSYFPWWANGPYSPGLGSCAGVICCKHSKHQLDAQIT